MKGSSGLVETDQTVEQHIYWHATTGLVVNTPEQGSLANWGIGVGGWFVPRGGLAASTDRAGRGGPT